jgi:hypothetical protein
VSRSVSRAPRLIGLVVLCVCIAAGRAHAQAWSAQLVIAPMPSSFLSDWEMDPTIGQLIVTNPGSAATDVTFHYTVTRNGKMLLRGTTDPLTIPGQQSVVFNGASTFGGRADWDRDVQQTIARTGKLPEGEYEGCVTLLGPGRIVLVDRQCVRFNTQSSDPPFLVSPANGDTLASRDPIFEWQPVQVPPSADLRVGYVLQIAEVRTAAGQRPEVALESNILHYVEPHLVQTSHQYPVGALPLVSGRTYAWRVQALDGEGKPAATNQGRSEIWTFVYRETETEVTRAVARLELTPRRDTLRYAGDTARYGVTAYDADNVEISGKRVQWRSLDSNVVQVDSTGVVSGVAAGETRIVATVDGVADSALSVTAAPGNLTVRFEAYDAATDKPGLLELLKSGSFDEVAPKLMAMLQEGEFRIPLPRLPGVEAAMGGGSSSGTGGMDGMGAGEKGRTRGGPSDASTGWAGALSSSWPARARACNDVAFNVRDPYMDLNQKVFVFYIPFNTEQRQGVTNCLGVPNDEGEVTEAERLRGAIFIMSWKHPGLPRAILAVKGPGFGGTIEGPKVDVRYLVLNLTPAIDVGSELLPANFGGFFGDVSFEAGTGLTFYSRRKCTENVRPLCRFLAWVNPENPFITISAFAGINASEASVGGGTDVKGAGISVALGFTISASLPVRKWNAKILGGSLDSTQVGLSFAVQDSIVEGAGAEEGPHHKSMNVAPTLKVWFTGSGGNSWEVDGSVAFEVDPDKPQDAVKLVVAAEVPARWKFWVARLGNPTVVFTRKLEAEGDVELGLSGTWGVGPWDGNPAEAVGLDAGDAGFEELGRGAVILKWEKPKAGVTAAENRLQQRQAGWDNARRTVAAQVALLARNCQTATIEAEQAKLVGERDIAAYGLSVEKNAKRDAVCRQAELEKTRQKAVDTEVAAEKAAIESAEKGGVVLQGPSGPPKCDGTLVFNDTRCYSWSARLSIGTSSLGDLMALVFRFATGTQ